MSNTPVNNNAPVSSSGFLEIDGNTSLQFMYAHLQLTQAKQMKGQAVEIMKTIQGTQALQKQTAEMIARARELQQKSKDGEGNCSGDKYACYMPPDMITFFNQHHIPIHPKGNDDRHNAEEWGFNLKGLTNFQDMLGNDTQTKMVYLQDYIGQYNSMLQGASQQITNSNQTMSTILRNS